MARARAASAQSYQGTAATSPAPVSPASAIGFAVNRKRRNVSARPMPYAAAANCSPKRTSPTARKRSSDQAIEATIRSAASAPWATPATKALAAPDADFFEVFDGARMVGQRGLRLARFLFVELVEVRVTGDEVLLVLAHRFHELVDHLVRDVSADADHDVDGLHRRGLVDAGDVRRRVDGREEILLAHPLHALLRSGWWIHRQHAQAADRGRHLRHCRRADREEEQIELA